MAGASTRTGQRRLTVRTYLIASFALCVAVLGILIWAATEAAARRERDRALDDLHAAAEGAAAWLHPEASGVEELLASMAGDQNVASLDPARCQPVFDALASGIAGAHLHVLDPTGREVCSLRVLADELLPQPLPTGEWADRAVEAGGLSFSKPELDPLSGQLAVTYGYPVGDQGAVMAAVLYTGDPPVDVPGVRDNVRLVVLDADREQVIATSPAAGVELGTEVRDTALAGPSRRAAVVDIDGERRYYQEAVVPTLGWHVLAGFDEDVALASAHAQQRWTLGIGVAVVGVVLVLGLALMGRLARPLRRFSAALVRSRDGDDDARAPVEGPAELADAAAQFNRLIEDRIAREAQLEHRATHDPLTGLPNRRALLRSLEEHATRGHPFAVLFLDLDRFKLVNDVHGHTVGDELLVTLAGALASAAGEDHLLARFGGDEFIVVCDGLSSEDDAVATATAMLEVVCAPHVVGDGLELLVSGSIGIAVWTPGDDATDLLRNADTAMYRAKAGGSGSHRVFDAAMRDWNVQRLTVEHDLYRALDRGELLLHYQPIRDLAAARVERVEALVRWRHPERGLLYPGDFIEIAADAGLIGRLGEVVLREATAMAAAWPKVEMSVNVAPAQLAGGMLIDQVRSALAQSGLPADRLCVEVTETGLLDDIDAAADVLHRLRALGVKVAIDDFGTGWSSLSWLQMLPVDEVKVDRSFVHRLLDDPASAAIVRAVAELSRSLGLRVVAEGVETSEQLEALRDLGITTVQGYLLGRPRPAEDLAALLGRSTVESL